MAESKQDSNGLFVPNYMVVYFHFQLNTNWDCRSKRGTCGPLDYHHGFYLHQPHFKVHQNEKKMFFRV